MWRLLTGNLLFKKTLYSKISTSFWTHSLWLFTLVIRPLLTGLGGQGPTTAQSHLSHTFAGLWHRPGLSLFRHGRIWADTIAKHWSPTWRVKYLSLSVFNWKLSVLSFSAYFKPVRIICARHKAVDWLMVHRHIQSSFGRLISSLILSYMKKMQGGYNFGRFMWTGVQQKNRHVCLKNGPRREPKTSQKKSHSCNLQPV